MAQLAHDLLLSQAKNADLETLFCLSLVGCNLIELGDELKQCIHLEILYASRNRISNLASFPLSNLSRLRSLYLDNNCITQLSHLKERNYTSQLEKLYLQGNFISDIEEVTSLATVFPNLRVLHLQDLVDSKSGSNRSNPVCKAANYRYLITRTFPNLTILDGERLLHPQSLQKLVKDICIAHPLQSVVEDNRKESKDSSLDELSPTVAQIHKYQCAIDALDSTVGESKRGSQVSELSEKIKDELKLALTRSVASQESSLSEVKSALDEAEMTLSKLDKRLQLLQN